MRLAVLKERRAGETRVAATPETVRKLVTLGLTVAIEAGAGSGASIPDADFSAAGAEIAADAAAALAGAGVVFAVQPPEGAARAAIPRGALLVCTSGAMADKPIVAAFAEAGIDVAAMELLPRITRAQSMDVLSSQANLAGYRAVIEGAFAFDRGFPMMMTAAGTVPPARVFVIGAGVAGLQAIATARRLGAIVSATDVRPAAKEEIKSLGGTFVGVEDTETAGQTGAYAKEMSADFKRKQAELMTATVAKNDLVICTALVQGGRAPVLVSQAMVDGMKPGSVVVDLASDGGGNCEATRPGEAYITDRGVKILGYRNWPGRISVAASNLYAKNLLTFLTTFWDKEARAPKLPEDDAIVKGVMLTRGGHVVHANFASGQPAPVQADAPAASAAAHPAEAPAMVQSSAPVVPNEPELPVAANDVAHEAAAPAAPAGESAEAGARVQSSSAPASLEPAPPAPASLEPASPEPTSPEPASTDPASPEPASTEPASAEPVSFAPVTVESVADGHDAGSESPTPDAVEAEMQGSAPVAASPPDENASAETVLPEHEAASLPADPAIAPQAAAATPEPPRTGPRRRGGRGRNADGSMQPKQPGEAE